ncbi:hypothetical protein [uncultured Jannaschia sp.]|uniref:hypothetical protein n=1 Tax=uncultured Jannaschia sp. TaxID=293347 RepID=UPI0026289343|nr:hypothetical protein [uncultured Jannaschia sp.]
MMQLAMRDIPTVKDDGDAERFRMIVAQGRRGLLHRDGRIALFGPALLQALGFRRDDDLRGLAFTSFWSFEDRPAVAEAVDAAEEEARTLRFDMRYHSGTDDAREVVFRPAPVRAYTLVELRDAPAV